MSLANLVHVTSHLGRCVPVVIAFVLDHHNQLLSVVPISYHHLKRGNHVGNGLLGLLR